MNDTAATEDQEQPAGCNQRKARVADRDPGRRISSGPADICSAPMTAAEQIVRSAKKVLAMEGRSLIACPLSMIFFVAASGHGSLRGRNNPPQHLASWATAKSFMRIVGIAIDSVSGRYRIVANDV